MELDRIAEQQASIWQPGDHLCCIYEDDAQHARIITSFVREGLNQGQRIVYVYDEHPPDVIMRFLEEGEVDCIPALDQGQLVFLSSQDTYLKGGSFDYNQMLDLIGREVDESLAQGYGCLRITGEMTWLRLDVPGIENFMEYERRLNAFPSAANAIILCQYHRTQTHPQILFDILLTHPKVMVDGSIYDNFYYLPGSTSLTSEHFSDRFDLWLDNLTRRRQIEWEHERVRMEISRRRLETMVEERTAQLQHEIRERQAVEEILRESESLSRALVNQAPLSILVVQDAHCVFANPAIVTRLGYASAYELVGKKIIDIISPESREIFLARQENILRGESADPVVTGFLCKEGSIYFSQNSAVPIFYQGRPATLLFAQDVTDRLRYEQQLMSSLSEKEVMLREIHHRVKNNLNVIVALIDLQKANQSDPQVLQVFKELQNRVYSMALVHENLFRSPSMAGTDFAGYLQNLTSYLYSGYAPKPEVSGDLPIQLVVEADNIPLRVETAIPCGLIVNELMTNALKYAFPKGFDRQPQITVRLQALPVPQVEGRRASRRSPDEKKCLRLTVADNGIGFPDHFQWRTTTTLGLQLVQVLARQLGAQILLDSNPGVTWTLTFSEGKQA